MQRPARGGTRGVGSGADGVLAAAKEFLAAGADAIVVLGAASGPLSTLANVARFHQALALGVRRRARPAGGGAAAAG